MVLNQADDIKIGTTQVDKVYLGSTLVWQKVQGYHFKLVAASTSALSADKQYILRTGDLSQILSSNLTDGNFISLDNITKHDNGEYSCIEEPLIFNGNLELSNGTKLRGKHIESSDIQVLSVEGSSVDVHYFDTYPPTLSAYDGILQNYKPMLHFTTLAVGQVMYISEIQML